MPRRYLQDIGVLDDRIGRAVLELVPAVGRADLDTGEGGLHVLDLGQELLARKVAAVHALGADGDGVDLVEVGRGVRLDGLLVGLVGLVGVGPVGGQSASGRSY